MGEPTLGARILDAADRHAEAYGWWLAETEEDEAPGPLHAKQRATRETVRALAARADAAERLARCCHELNNIDFDDYLEALAAWRVIEGNEVTG